MTLTVLQFAKNKWCKNEVNNKIMKLKSQKLFLLELHIVLTNAVSVFDDLSLESSCIDFIVPNTPLTCVPNTCK